LNALIKVRNIIQIKKMMQSSRFEGLNEIPPIVRIANPLDKTVVWAHSCRMKTATIIIGCFTR
jgi:hypothetical protein